MTTIGHIGNGGVYNTPGSSSIEGGAAMNRVAQQQVLSAKEGEGGVQFGKTEDSMFLPPPKMGGIQEQHIAEFSYDKVVSSPTAMIEALGLVMSDMAIEMRKQQKQDMIGHMKERLAALDKKKEEQLAKASDLKFGAILSGAVNIGAAAMMGFAARGAGKSNASPKATAPKVPTASAAKKMETGLPGGSKPMAPGSKAGVKDAAKNLNGDPKSLNQPAATTPKADPKPMEAAKAAQPKDGPKKSEADAAAAGKTKKDQPQVNETDKANRMAEAQNSMMKFQAMSMAMQGMAGAGDGFFQAEAAVHDAMITGHEKLETTAETKFQKAKGLAEEYQSLHQEVLSTMKDLLSQQRSIGEAINSKA
ncbi:hypothetical protein [Acanthopleuribacter pedis]|uniref:Uncharacterized protein n=1 Tax=Acanthopleuribacter pedis TaxID=442870 RepID=A0A8J7U963_9BACT|nr:hypothetical protein [Acanthopleuribacter pedis]MBO1323331.1 hypothetical protein [Acanthopleuribacter pedis]